LNDDDFCLMIVDCNINIFDDIIVVLGYHYIFICDVMKIYNDIWWLLSMLFEIDVIVMWYIWLVWLYYKLCVILWNWYLVIWIDYYIYEYDYENDIEMNSVIDMMCVW